MTGFVRFRAHGGDLDNARLDPDISTGLDFSNDTEVHVVMRGQHDAMPSIEYGGTVEFEADTNRSDNTDESWLFLRGGFGELRFGDEDGVVDNSAVTGAFSRRRHGRYRRLGDRHDRHLGVQAHQHRRRHQDPLLHARRSAASRWRPATRRTRRDFGSGGVNGDSLALTDVEVGDVVDGGLIYEGDLGGLGLTASIVGEYGEVKDSDAFGGGDDLWGYFAGAAAEVFGLSVAGGYGNESIGRVDREWFNAGVGAALGPANFSVTYGQIIDSDDRAVLDDAGVEVAEIGDAYNLVFSADVGLMPGLILGGDVGLFDNDISGDVEGVDDDGYQAIVRLDLAF